MSAALDSFFEQLTRPTPIGVFNPWIDRSSDDLHVDAAAQRLARLQTHLNSDEPTLLLIGEAPGWQGCRISGLAFTSEHLLLSGAIPNIVVRSRISDAARPLREPSATMVWEALDEFGVADRTILWNAFPYHPHLPDNPFSNRTPSEAERASAEPLLRSLLAAYPSVTIAAIGRIAAQSVTALTGKDTPVIRHPSFGGKLAFRVGLETVLYEAGKLKPRLKLYLHDPIA